MGEYGSNRYGGVEYGGGPDDLDPDLPLNEVDITAPVGVIDTNPVLVEWVFTHDDPGVQLEYRVRLENEDGIEVYDTGWVASPTMAATVDVVATGVGGEETVRLIVSAHDSSRGYAGTGIEVVTTELGQPTVAFIEPDPTSHLYFQPLLACEWSYDDTRARPQAESRVRLMLGVLVLYDSGWQVNTEHVWDVPYLLFDGTSYTVGLRVRNDIGIESVGVT